VITISTVTPVYSGEKYLEELINVIAEIKLKWQADSAPFSLNQSIFVMDDPRDNSMAVLEAMKEKYSWIKIVTLSRNFGQHSATVAGILHTSSDWVITLDEDLQHNPKDIEKMLQKAVENSSDIVYAHPITAVHQSVIRDYGSRMLQKAVENSSDIVYAHPITAVHQSVIRDYGSRCYKYMISNLSENSNIRFFNSFRLIRGSIARAAGSVSGFETYFDIALSWFTTRINSYAVEIKDQRCISGAQSGYNIKRLFAHAGKMIISTHLKSLRIGAYIGVGAVFVSMLMFAYLCVNILFFDPTLLEDIRGWASLFTAILFFGGLLSFLLSIVLEYISVVLMDTLGKPAYFEINRNGDQEILEYFRSKSKL